MWPPPPPKKNEKINFAELIVISVGKCIRKGWWHRALLKSCSNRTTLMYIPNSRNCYRMDQTRKLQSRWGRSRYWLILLIPNGTDVHTVDQIMRKPSAAPKIKISFFNGVLIKDKASGVQRVPMHPRDLVGLSDDFLPTYRVTASNFSWYTYETCIQLSSFAILGSPNQNPQSASPRASWAHHRRMGPYMTWPPGVLVSKKSTSH